jgi:hypothetical protein
MAWMKDYCEDSIHGFQRLGDLNGGWMLSLPKRSSNVLTNDCQTHGEI